MEDSDLDRAFGADLVVAAQPDGHPLDGLHAHRALGTYVVDDGGALIAVIAGGNSGAGKLSHDRVFFTRVEFDRRRSIAVVTLC
jgi:hypothetical protein